MLKRFFFFVMVVLPCALWSQGNERPFYKIFVRIEPNMHQIDCKFEANNPTNPGFYLHSALKISSLTVDGKPASFHEEQYAKRVIDAVVDSQFVVEYSGVIADTANGVNMIQPDLVELALYSAWYPIIDNAKQFEFELTLDLPEGMTTVTNGRLMNQEEHSGRVVSVWHSFQLEFDIAMLASPKLKTMALEKGKTKVQFYYDLIPESVILAKKDSLVHGMERLTQWYGKSTLPGQLRFVYSPRGGWGYSRIPLFVTPQAYALSQINQPLGEARDLHGSFHEMSHFWWLIADTRTTNDWINEGLAEYSAFRLSEASFGKAFADTLLTEYRNHAANCATKTPIVETASDSRDRYVNRYEKTTLMFVKARQMYGEAELDDVLASLYRQFAKKRSATTEAFLQEVENKLGSQPRAWFETILTNPEWSSLE